MTLRLALVIDGQQTGARKALEDTAAGIDKVSKGAAEASAKTAEVGKGLTEAGKAAETTAKAVGDTGRQAETAARSVGGIGTAANEAKGAIGSLAVAATTAAPKFDMLKGAAMGFVATIAGGIAGGVVAAGLDLVTESFANYVARILSDTPRINDDLKSHKQLIDEIKGAYAEAEGAASSYGRNSTTLLRFRTQQNIGRLEGDYGDSLPAGGLFNLGLAVGDTNRGNLGPFADAVHRLVFDIRDGKADVIAFRAEIAGIAEALPADSASRPLAEELLGKTERAAEIQAELARSRDLLKGLQGDADAAATALGGSAEKYTLLNSNAGAANQAIATTGQQLNAVNQAAGGAVPNLTQVNQLLGSIAAKGPRLPAPTTPNPTLQAPSSQSATRLSAAPPDLTPIAPYAAGGIVDRPTLFSYDGGRTGLMGEAGPEAILPLHAGLVRARIGAGRETGLSLTRLSDGSLGVDAGFARGGVVSRFAAGGAIGGRRAQGGEGFGVLADDIDILRGSLAAFLSELRNGESVLSALGSVVTEVSDRFLDSAFNALDRAVFGSGGGVSLLVSLFGGSQYGRAASGLAAPGLYHGGGRIGFSPSATRTVSPGVFMDAPRFHRGGLVGGEVPIIAQEGEEIGWPDQLARKYGRGGSTNNFYIETPDARSFAESRATVGRAAARIAGRAGRYV